MKKTLISAAVLLMLCAGSAFAAVSSVSSTTDYLTAQRPPTMIGTITAVNDHHISLTTSDNEVVMLATDSHSMLPPDIAPGMVARVEFKVMETGQHYTQRVTPIRNEDEASLALLNARHTDINYASNEVRTFEGEDADAADYPNRVSSIDADREAQLRADRAEQDRLDREEDAREAAEKAANDRDRDVAGRYEDSESLPQTASNQPLIALVGVFALAGAYAISRRRRGI